MTAAARMLSAGGHIDAGRNILTQACPEVLSAPDAAAEAWLRMEVLALAAVEEFYRNAPLGQAATLLALAVLIEALASLFSDPAIALICPLSCATHLQRASEWAVAAGQLRRARAFLQLGSAFKLEGLWRWLALSRQNPEWAKTNPRFQSRMHAEYTIVAGQLQASQEVPQRPLRRWHRPHPPSVEVHSLCYYKPSAGKPAASSLPDLSAPNHRAYASRHGHRYVLHTELPRPELEPQYNKMALVAAALRAPDAPEWVFFVDCDAFFTNFEIGIGDILETYGAATAEPASPHFLVAEDPGGINTGVFLVKNSPWSLNFLARVESNVFRVAWDQSMFFWEILWPSLFDANDLLKGDYRLPDKIAFVHQAHLNAFVPPASTDWHAYEWQSGDFICHFAGCPFQESECHAKMVQIAEFARQQWLGLNSSAV
eukprot:gnl/TRDRNA2_/TRDRNA2_93315_c0_seq2.p1 gnl/TRDRNA2_/TRDRNA2_93315_c0~~gnl/TRDRNA2_/TRDRNA2_93315_c0_seq2.p1  ORF type:complete len:428 (+),score=64.02 gnl/TRDRNA2_/TRDRNA2_93315_c0_seq2:63-1346(+)